MAQSRSPQPSVTSTPPRPRSFWLAALVGLPVVNGALLFAAASVAHTFLVPELALVAFGELALLIVLAWRYRIGVFGAIGAMLGNAAITVLGVAVVVYVALAIACRDATECL